MKRFMEQYKGQLLLILLLGLGPLVIYQLALARTVELAWNVRKERQKIEQLQQESRTGDFTRSSERLLPDPDPLNPNQPLSDFLFARSAENNCLVDSYTPYGGVEEYPGIGFSIVTAEAVLTGEFSSLIRVVEALEEHPQRWKVISVNFQSTRPDVKIKEIKLKLTLLLQYIAI